jgi:hypothetical protein
MIFDQFSIDKITNHISHGFIEGMRVLATVIDVKDAFEFLNFGCMLEHEKSNLHQ